MGLLICFINKNRKREILDYGNNDTVTITPKEPVLICYVDLNGVKQFPSGLTPAEQMLMTGTMGFQDLDDSDFRRAGIAFTINTTNGKNMFPMSISEYNTTNARYPEILRTYIDMTYTLTPPSHGCVGVASVLPAGVGIYSFSNDCVVLHQGVPIELKAGKWFYCSSVVTFDTTRTSMIGWIGYPTS